MRPKLRPGDVVQYRNYKLPGDSDYDSDDAGGPPARRRRGDVHKRRPALPVKVYDAWLAIVSHVPQTRQEKWLLDFGVDGYTRQERQVGFDRALGVYTFAGHRLWKRIAKLQPGDVPLLDLYGNKGWKREIVRAWNTSFTAEMIGARNDPRAFTHLSMFLQQRYRPRRHESLQSALQYAQSHHPQRYAYGNFVKIDGATAKSFLDRVREEMGAGGDDDGDGGNQEEPTPEFEPEDFEGDIPSGMLARQRPDNDDDDDDNNNNNNNHNPSLAVAYERYAEIVERSMQSTNTEGGENEGQDDTAGAEFLTGVLNHRNHIFPTTKILSFHSYIGSTDRLTLQHLIRRDNANGDYALRWSTAGGPGEARPHPIPGSPMALLRQHIAQSGEVVTRDRWAPNRYYPHLDEYMSLVGENVVHGIERMHLASTIGTYAHLAFTQAAYENLDTPTILDLPTNIDEFVNFDTHYPAYSIGKTILRTLREEGYEVLYTEYPVYSAHGLFGGQDRHFESRADWVGKRGGKIVMGENKSVIGTGQIGYIFGVADEGDPLDPASAGGSVDVEAFHQVFLNAWLFEMSTGWEVGEVAVAYASRRGHVKLVRLPFQKDALFVKLVWVTFLHNMTSYVGIPGRLRANQLSHKPLSSRRVQVRGTAAYLIHTFFTEEALIDANHEEGPWRVFPQAAKASYRLPNRRGGVLMIPLEPWDVPDRAEAEPTAAAVAGEEVRVSVDGRQSRLEEEAPTSGHSGPGGEGLEGEELEEGGADTTESDDDNEDGDDHDAGDAESAYEPGRGHASFAEENYLASKPGETETGMGPDGLASELSSLSIRAPPGALTRPVPITVRNPAPVPAHAGSRPHPYRWDSIPPVALSRRVYPREEPSRNRTERQRLVDSVESIAQELIKRFPYLSYPMSPEFRKLEQQIEDSEWFGPRDKSQDGNMTRDNPRYGLVMLIRTLHRGINKRVKTTSFRSVAHPLHADFEHFSQRGLWSLSVLQSGSGYIANGVGDELWRLVEGCYPALSGR